MKKYRFEDLDSRTGIHCPAKWMAEKVTVYFASKGFKWSNGEPYIENTKWKLEKEKMVYYPKDGLYGSIDSDLIKNGPYKVIAFNQFDMGYPENATHIKRINLLEKIKNETE